jgi:hypothetical protein
MSVLGKDENQTVYVTLWVAIAEKFKSFSVLPCEIYGAAFV